MWRPSRRAPPHARPDALDDEAGHEFGESHPPSMAPQSKARPGTVTALFVAQRNDGVYAGGTTSREVASEYSDHSKDGGREYERDRICNAQLQENTS